MQTGKQKAKEAIEKEREKARLKKLERERSQNDKAQSKQTNRERKVEDSKKQLDLALAVTVPSPRDLGNGASKATDTKADARARALAASPVRVAEPLVGSEPSKPSRGRVSGKADGSTLEEKLVRKLWALLDRNSKASISPRDVLVALKKHPQVRCLFGLPTNAAPGGGESLEARLLAIQDAFEAGSGLGEVGPVFAELREASGASDQTFGWEAFLAGVRKGCLRANAAAAAALLPREHATGQAFVPTAKWTEVPEGAACPAGLEYKMDMESGRTLARLPPGRTK